MKSGCALRVEMKCKGIDCANVMKGADSKLVKFLVRKDLATRVSRECR